MNGTAAMYVYAITAVIPNMSGARLADKKIVVGPSAPHIIPIEAASPRENVSAAIKFSPSAPQKATNIPI